MSVIATICALLDTQIDPQKSAMTTPILALLTFLYFATNGVADTCYVRASDQIAAQPSPGWSACNNTQGQADGVKLCCMSTSTCGEDSICRTSDSGGGSVSFSCASSLTSLC